MTTERAQRPPNLDRSDPAAYAGVIFWLFDPGQGIGSHDLRIFFTHNEGDVAMTDGETLYLTLVGVSVLAFMIALAYGTSVSGKGPK